MITILGAQFTILELIEALPSIVSAVVEVENLVKALTLPQPTRTTLLGKAVVSAIAITAGKPNPAPYTEEEQAMFDRAAGFPG